MIEPNTPATPPVATQPAAAPVAPPHPPITPKPPMQRGPMPPGPPMIRKTPPGPQKPKVEPENKGKHFAHAGKARPTAAALADLQANADIPAPLKAQLTADAATMNAEVLKIDFHITTNGVDTVTYNGTVKKVS